MGTFSQNGVYRLGGSADTGQHHQARQSGCDGAGEVAGHRTLLGLFLAEVPVPERGAVVVADGQTYVLNALETRDQSLERWVVTRG